MRLSLNTAPSVEPCTLAEVRAWLRLPDSVTTDDTMIEDILIPAARRACEGWMNRKIISQKWLISLDSQPSRIELPYGYVTEVDSVKTIDDDGTTETTESASTCYHAVTGEQAQIFLRNGATWTTTTRAYDVMRIIYTVGWANAAAAPPELKQAVIATAAYWYEHPDAMPDGLVPKHAQAAMRAWWIPSL